MNSQWIILASVLIFMLVEETTSLQEVEFYRNVYRTPLALIKNNNSQKVQLAIPQEYKQNHDLVSYFYDDTEEDENGPKEKFLIACPAYYDGKSAEKDGEVHFLMEYGVYRGGCFSELVPSIKRIRKENGYENGVKYCNQSKSEIYGVGYELSNREESSIQYVFVYKICYSKAEGKTLYSIHRIETPSLLLLDRIEELPKPKQLDDLHESFLDLSLSTKKYFEGKKYYAYQYVGAGDMLIRPWELTTEFLFNYAPITKNADIIMGMIRADFYIRLYSKKNNKPLTLYSGTHQKQIKSRIPCLSKICKPTLVDLFWRIIVDDEGYAIILVTQHTQEKCDQAYLCDTNRQVKTYKNGGCIYTCSLNTNDPLFGILDLPSLKIAGDLDFTFQTGEINTHLSEEGKSSRTITTPNTDILSFLGNVTFLTAVTNVDPDIASNLDFQSAPADHGIGESWWTGGNHDDGGSSWFSGGGGDTGGGGGGDIGGGGGGGAD